MVAAVHPIVQNTPSFLRPYRVCHGTSRTSALYRGGLQSRAEVFLGALEKCKVSILADARTARSAFTLLSVIETPGRNARTGVVLELRHSCNRR
jgi:hypothetical protein